MRRPRIGPRHRSAGIRLVPTCLVCSRAAQSGSMQGWTWVSSWFEAEKPGLGVGRVPVHGWLCPLHPVGDVVR